MLITGGRKPILPNDDGDEPDQSSLPQADFEMATATTETLKLRAEFNREWAAFKAAGKTR